MSEYRCINLFIAGIGAIGKTLLQQLSKQQHSLHNSQALSINIVGIANSKRIIASPKGVDINSYPKLMKEAGTISSAEQIKNTLLRLSLPNTIFVDCTSSTEIANIYLQLLNNKISVVAANKAAASSDYDSYLNLKQAAVENGVKYLFQTNVGGGLPIISTINSLVNSGDKVLKIEAVLSGTLNYIINTISKEVPFSKAVKMAQELGFSEPDPRIDLSGDDVVKKLVILARESGYTLSKNEVNNNLPIPIEAFKGDINDFFEQIKRYDIEFEQKRIRAEQNGNRLRFCAIFEKGCGFAGLMEVGAEHPFYNLPDSNNIVMLTTERYNNHPLVIKGYGAGAAVTAGGVFGDILRVANIA